MARQSKRLTSNQLRLIAGNWRGRKLSFPDVEGLRPTPDRVRETVFNWLQPWLAGARCLDLFAGSGALGLEAASRGADSVDMVELNSQAYKQLQQNITLLSASQCHVFNQAAQQFLASAKKTYDIVFIDPPYQLNLWTEVADLLTRQHLLAENALIYLECPVKSAMPPLPQQWHLLKDKKAGDVRYCLFQLAGELE